VRAFLAIAAVMQLAAVIALGVAGLGLVFGLLELFTVFSAVITVLELIWRHQAPRGRPGYIYRAERWPR
jgi:hypothetical protein